MSIPRKIHLAGRIVLCFFFAVNSLLPTEAAVRNEPTYTLVSIQVNGYELEGIHPVLQENEKLYLPLLIILVGTEIVDPVAVLAEEDDFDLDWNNKSITLDRNGSSLKVRRKNTTSAEYPVIRWSGEAYVSATALKSLFGLKVDLSKQNPVLMVSSERPLPIDIRRMREQRWTNLQDNGPTRESDFLSVERPYVLWGDPRGNFQARGTQSTSRATLSVGAELAFEAGFLTNDMFLSGTKANGLNALRWASGRRDAKGQVFGLDSVYEIRFGDITSLALPISARSASGRGIYFSTAPLNRSSLFDVTEIRGNALPGWDVELYRNGQLLDFLSVGSDGRYQFTDIPLTLGTNSIKVLLYGPQGQIEERVLQQNFNAGQLPPGDWQLSGSVLQIGENMISIDKQRSSGGWQLAMRADYGLSRRLTTGVFVNHNHQPATQLDQSNNTLQKLTKINSLTDIGILFRPSIGLLTTEWSGVYQSTDGYAFRGAGGFSVLGFNNSFRVDYFSDAFIFDQRRPRSRQSLQNKIDLRTRRSLGRWGSLSLNFRYSVSRNGSSAEAVGSSYRHSVFGANFSHSLRLQKLETVTNSQYQFLASKRWGEWVGRFELQANGRSIDTLTANAIRLNTNYRWNNNRNISFTASQSLRSNQSLRFKVELSQRLRFATLGASASYSRTGFWGIGFSVSFGLGSAGKQPIMFLPQGSQRQGAIQANIFRDVTGDGELSSRDRPIRAASVRVNGASTPVRSNEEGTLSVFGLPVDQPVDIELDVDSLPDPFLATNKSRLRVYPRPGFTHEIDIPLQDAAFIYGNVFVNSQSAAGIRVIAENVETGARESTISLSDGYYSIERLAPGKWEIFVAEESLSDRWKSAAIDVNLSPGDSISDANITIYEVDHEQ